MPKQQVAKQEQRPAPIGRRELAQQIATRLSGVSESQVYEVLNTMTDVVTEHLQAGRSVALTGFGTWSPTTRRARAGTNIRTGQKIAIPERRAALFKNGAHLKHALAGA
jgi:DNA-binding protein HU-beta